MMHKSRRYVVRAMATLADTVAKLAHGNYCGCVGISFNGTVYLNDATSGDGVEEWAVFRNGRQVESITFGWMSPAEIEETVRRMDAEPWDAFKGRGSSLPQIQTRQEHGTCPCCA